MYACAYLRSAAVRIYVRPLQVQEVKIKPGNGTAKFEGGSSKTLMRFAN